MTDSPAGAGRKRRRVWLLAGLTVLFVALGAGYFVYWYTIARFSVATDDAYVHGNRVALMPQIAGTVTAIRADNTDLVERGQTLVELDPSDTAIALQQAEAHLAQTVRDVRQLYEQAAKQKAVVEQRRTTLAQAERDYRRAHRLQAQHAISEEKFQQDETNWQNAAASLQAAQHQLAALQAQIQDIDVRHHPRVRLAESALRKAWLDRERATLVAPVTGFVAQRSVQVGQQAKPGAALLSIVPLGQLWVEANFKETDLTRVRIGQPATIHADFYGGGVTFHGTVTGVSVGTGSAFELLPPQNATGNWIKVVQRVPVRIALDPAELAAHPLRLGLSLSVEIDVHDTSGATLASAAAPADVYSTPVFRRNQAGVDALIAKIVRDNDAPAGASADGATAPDGE